MLDPLKQLEREGFEVTWLKPESDGIVRPEQVRAALRADTQLVSLMHVNNETGVIQDVAAIGAICRERGVAFHVDAAQSAGKLPIERRGDEHRPAVAHRAQDLRPEGHRCAVRAAQAAARPASR